MTAFLLYALVFLGGVAACVIALGVIAIIADRAHRRRRLNEAIERECREARAHAERTNIWIRITAPNDETACDALITWSQDRAA